MMNTLDTTRTPGRAPTECNAARTVSAVVLAAPPTLQITGVPTGTTQAGTDITLNGTANVPGTTDQFALSWSIIDIATGNSVASGAGASVTYPKAAGGNYLVTLTASAGNPATSVNPARSER